MPRSATAFGSNHDISTFSVQSGFSDTWLSDPIQLADWQGQLVSCCHEINQQLSGIRDELIADQAFNDNVSANPFRLFSGRVH